MINWKVIGTLVYLFGLVLCSPMLMNIIDLFYWFWTGVTISGYNYGDGGRFFASCLFFVPGLMIFFFGSAIWGAVLEEKKREDIAKKIQENNNEG